VRLDPPSLGEIRIHVESSAHGINVRIVAQSHETLALLADHQQELSRQLWRHGLALQSFSTSVAGDDRGSLPGGRDELAFGRRNSQAEPPAGSHVPLEAVRPGHTAEHSQGLDTRA
jgi:flagellar hook-length control protein FliK